MNKVVERFNKLLNISFIMIILDILVGILFISKPELSNKVALITIGSLIIVHGLYNLINFFYDGLGNPFFKIELLSGLINLVLGIAIILNPINTINILGIGFGLWLLVNGLEVAYYTYKFLKSNEEIAPLILFVSVASIIMGIIVMINPFSSFMVITKLIGLFIVANGGINIIRVILYKKRAKNLLKIFD